MHRTSLPSGSVSGQPKPLSTMGTTCTGSFMPLKQNIILVNVSGLYMSVPKIDMLLGYTQFYKE